MSDTPEITQPLHPSILPLLDPDYRAFHEANLLHFVSPHLLPWSPAIRDRPAVPGGSEPLKVAAVKDFKLTHTSVRTFTPFGTAPEKGWPAFVFFHGGGWTLGNIESEAGFSTNMAERAKCVVISVDYRLAPEHKYPAAVEDAVESLQWLIKNGKHELKVDTSRIAVGGSSSGGNLAAVLALKAVQLSLPTTLIFQLHVVPVTDNTLTTSTPSSSWSSNQHTPWLSPARMDWFKNNYIPDPAQWTEWEASPIFAPDELLKETPPAWIGVGELDILRDEGVGYGERLRGLGVEVEVKVYKGAPHPIMAMDGMCCACFLAMFAGR
ncbi:alpha/beta hydrolase fold-domain-containing protein [Pterulicium gracile]|uniref:Alpha/beta hydrolase fold-domain-containing protein n=1 Tax=Pterulicium gracile TaxID=1884261 RepID=A0A5C3QNZ5_9AGAR|nr:alpha/beta hydrolase fold-domain-containing protein [Pterula gracilis]